LIEHAPRARLRPQIAALVVALAGGLLAACTIAAAPSPSPSARPTFDVQAEITAVSAGLDDALSKYRAGDKAGAQAAADDAYLEHFEHVEDPLGDKDHEFMEELEDLLRDDVRGAITAGKPADDVAALIATAKAKLTEAASKLR
jgi:hypothetical protein